MKKNVFSIVLCVLSLFAVSACCGDDLPPDAVGLGVEVFNKENGSIDNIGDTISGIIICLRNDKLSDSIIQEKKTHSNGTVDFNFCKDRPFRDDIFVSDEEFSAIWNGKTDYYLVVNDPKSSSYNSEYETRILSYRNGESLLRRVHLPRKS